MRGIIELENERFFRFDFFGEWLILKSPNIAAPARSMIWLIPRKCPKENAWIISRWRHAGIFMTCRFLSALLANWKRLVISNAKHDMKNDSVEKYVGDDAIRERQISTFSWYWKLSLWSFVSPISFEFTLIHFLLLVKSVKISVL